MSCGAKAGTKFVGRPKGPKAQVLDLKGSEKAHAEAGLSPALPNPEAAFGSYCPTRGEARPTAPASTLGNRFCTG